MQLPLEGGCLCGPGAVSDQRCAARCRLLPLPDVPARRRGAGRPLAEDGERGLHLDCLRARRLSLLARGRAPVLPDLRHQLVFREIAAPGTLDVTLASPDDPSAVAPGHHIWTASRIGWFEIADDLPRFPERAPDDAS
jgi:hypothetical protein